MDGGEDQVKGERGTYLFHLKFACWPFVFRWEVRRQHRCRSLPTGPVGPNRDCPRLG